MSAHYKKTLDELRQRYQDVLGQKRGLNDELRSLAKTIEGLASLCGEEPNIPNAADDSDAPAKILAESWLKYMPFADAVRTALRMIHPNAFSTSDIRELLVRAGYPMHERTKPMIALNVALKRMHEAEEVEVVEKAGRKTYKWAFKNEQPTCTSTDWSKILAPTSYELELGDGSLERYKELEVTSEVADRPHKT